MTSIAIFGGAGYTGRELLRILSGHPWVEVVHVTSSTHPGQPLGAIFPELARAYPTLAFTARDAALPAAVEVAFLCLPHGESMAAVPPLLARGVRVIDLSADYRLQRPSLYREWYGRDHSHPELLGEAVYGLPEWHHDEINAEVRLLANPGCYPTATLLALLPAVEAGLVRAETVVVNACSGVSGAGVRPSETTHFVHANESLKAYKVGRHPHTPEIEQLCSEFAGAAVTLSFTPHLAPMNRGILVTASATLAKPVGQEEAWQLYRDRYGSAPFVHLLAAGQMPDTARVRGSNQAHLQVVVDPRSQRLVMLSAIDNLVKGAAGQAVQNLNLMLGWEETTGLLAPPVVP